MAPIEIKADSVFEEEYNYHFDDAKSKLRENDRAGTASEIRKAGSLLLSFKKKELFEVNNHVL